jgi:hypothetical protein
VSGQFTTPFLLHLCELSCLTAPPILFLIIPLRLCLQAEGRQQRKGWRLHLGACAFVALVFWLPLRAIAAFGPAAQALHACQLGKALAHLARRDLPPAKARTLAA